MLVKDTVCPSSLVVKEIGQVLLPWVGGILPYVQGKPRVQWSNHPGGSVAKILFHTTTRPLLGLPNKHLGGVTS